MRDINVETRFGPGLLAHGRAETHIKLVGTIVGNQDGFLTRFGVIRVFYHPVQEYVIEDRQRGKITVLDAENNAFRHRLTRGIILPAADEFTGGEEQGFEGFSGSVRSEGMEIQLPFFGFRQLEAAIFVPFLGVDLTAFRQCNKNVIQAVRVEKYPLHRHRSNCSFLAY